MGTTAIPPISATTAIVSAAGETRLGGTGPCGAIIRYCHGAAFWYVFAVNKSSKPLLFLLLSGFVFFTPSFASAQQACRVQPNFVRPDFVRARFDKVDVVRNTIERPSLERASLERPDFVRPAFERPSFVRPVFDDQCAKQNGSSGSFQRSSYAAVKGLIEDKDSKLAQNGEAKTEIPRHGMVLAARAKAADQTAVGACCGQPAVSREQQHRLYR